ncbi:MAG: carboxypeptidase regulatory-like domain-containing protein [Candidatus Andersenbacteria bacterium]
MRANPQPSLPVIPNAVSPQSGFTILELLIATFIIAVVVTGLFGFFVLSLRSTQEAERRVVATALGNERAEMIRNLPYELVGTVGGIPSGNIAQEETITRNGTTYTVRTDIRYIDDPFDGVAGGSSGGGCIEICHSPPGNPDSENTLCVPQSALNSHFAHGDTNGPCEGQPAPGPDLINADYKQARIEVAWSSPQPVRPLLLVMQISPAGVEGSESAGTLDFLVLNAAGQGVASAAVRLVNPVADPPIDVTTNTNSEGRVVLPGLPVSTESYQIIVSKTGYTSEQTYSSSATFTPDTDHAHLSMLAGQITSKTFSIDQISVLNITTQDEEAATLPGITYILKGTKTIGVDDDDLPVYLVDETEVTDSSGEFSHATLPWDAYEFDINEVATNYDIKETSSLLPLQLNPAQTVDLVVTLVPHTDISLHVSVVTPAGVPVDNATVEIAQAPSFNDISVTGSVGQVFFADLPSSGDYQITIDAPGHQQYTGTVSISGTTRTTLQLAPL